MYIQKWKLRVMDRSSDIGLWTEMRIFSVYIDRNASLDESRSEK